jgi:hypothetical protein
MCDNPWRGTCLSAIEPSCTLPHWTLYTRESRVHELREFVFVEANRVPLLYWITPKAAHTTIVNRLLRRPPFRIVEIVSADVPEASRRARWRAIVEKHAPLEFTFVREPVGQLLSALDQMRFCRGLGAAESVHDYLATFFEFVDDKWPAPHCRELHMYPQVAGYPAPGFARLHFVGRVHRLRKDWSSLLRAINVSTGDRATDVVNRRARPKFIRNDATWSVFATHPSVKAHTEWDLRCIAES